MYDNRPNQNQYGGYPPQPQQYQQYPQYAPVPHAHAQPAYGQPYGAQELYGERRYEGDLSEPAVAAFAKKVYAYFGSALLVAMAAAFGGTMAVDHFASVGNVSAINGIWIGSLVAFFASYLIVVFSRKSHSSLKTGLLYVFAASAGGMLAPVLMAHVAAGMGMAIVFAFGIASVIFFGISVYVLATGKDFRGLGSYLVIGILVIVGVWLMSLFISFPSVLHTVLMGGGMLLFIGFTLFDTSRVVRDNFYANDAVSAAINLLYDFFMLFRYALYFMGASRD